MVYLCAQPWLLGGLLDARLRATTVAQTMAYNLLATERANTGSMSDR